MDTRYSRRFVRGGNETATLCVTISESTEEICGFYRELAEECEQWCEEHIASLEEYRARGCRAVRYVFEASETDRSEREIGMRLRVYFCYGAGNGETLFDERHRWSLRDGAMLMPSKRQSKAKKNVKALKKIKNIEKSS